MQGIRSFLHWTMLIFAIFTGLALGWTVFVAG